MRFTSRAVAAGIVAALALMACGGTDNGTGNGQGRAGHAPGAAADNARLAPAGDRAEPPPA